MTKISLLCWSETLIKNCISFIWSIFVAKSATNPEYKPKSCPPSNEAISSIVLNNTSAN